VFMTLCVCEWSFCHSPTPLCTLKPDPPEYYTFPFTHAQTHVHM